MTRTNRIAVTNNALSIIPATAVLVSPSSVGSLSVGTAPKQKNIRKYDDV